MSLRLRTGMVRTFTLFAATVAVIAMVAGTGIDRAIAQPAPTAPPTAQVPDTTPPTAPQPDTSTPADPTPVPDAPGETPVATPAPDDAAVSAFAGPQAPVPASADADSFVCWGDSLSYHVCDPNEGNYLHQAFGGSRHVFNRAVGGQNSTEIATRMGAYHLGITFPGNTIPASGSVRVEMGYLPNTYAIFASPVWIHGVEGRLVRERVPFGGWIFERFGSGAAVQISPNEPVHMLESNARNHPGMIWVGRNNVQQPTQVIADVAAMVAKHRETSNQPMWVVGMTPSKGEPYGSVESQWIAQVNSTLRETYGDFYIPMDDYLRDIAMRDLGMAMTQADRDAVARGILPPSLTIADGMHFNDAGRRAIAGYIASIVKDPGNEYLRNFDPQGSQGFVLDEASGTLQVVGWGFDKSNVTTQLRASVSLNGVVVSQPVADWPSPYLAQYGVPGNHAFWTAIQLGTGPNEVCVTFHNIGAGADLRLPCKTFDLSWKPDGRSPQGDSVFMVDQDAGRVTVVGWAFDHSHLTSTVDMQVTINGKEVGRFPASQPSDYLYAYGVPGRHGFVGNFELPIGTSRVCVTALDIAPGRNTTLRCDNLTVTAHNPEGHANVTMLGDGTLQVRGLTFDRSDFGAPVNVAVFQNSQLTQISPANALSPELHQFGVFAPHGINMRVTPISTAAPLNVCLLAINVGRGESTWLGCWETDFRAISPKLAFATHTTSDGRMSIDGWAFDSSVPVASVPVTITVDGLLRARMPADDRRSELATIFGWPGDHGFTAYLDRLSPGSHQVCVTAHNIGTDASNTVDCRTVTV